MSQYTLYPRFYTTSSLRGDGVQISEGDATVVALYDFYVNRTVSSTTWRFRKEVLETAIRLFGNIGQWLADQDHNPRVVGYNLLFIKDTVRFVRTGERQMRPETWIELVNENEEGLLPVSHAQNDTLRMVLATDEQKTSAFLAKWCSQPNGVEDLVCTLHVLFGHSRKQAA